MSCEMDSCAAHSSNRSHYCNTIVARIVAVKTNYIHRMGIAA